jgi:hypothetical protein
VRGGGGSSTPIVVGDEVDIDENERVKSRPDPFRFPHLTPHFHFFRKNSGTGRVTGRLPVGVRRKRGRLPPVRIPGVPYLVEMDLEFNPHFDPDIQPTRLQPIRPNSSSPASY